MTEKLTIDIHEQTNFTAEEKKIYAEAKVAVEKVLNSKRFKTKFLAAKLTNVEGLTNEKIYTKLMSGIDLFNKTADYDIDVYVEMYYKNNRVVGYTTPSINKTYLNRKFFSQYDAADIACNMVHEYLHKVGFDHESASEHTSVPYAIGYLLEACIREMWAKPKLYNDEPEVKPVPVEVPEPETTPEPKPLPNPLPEPKPEPVPESVKKKVCKRLWYTLWLKEVCWYEN